MEDYERSLMSPIHEEDSDVRKGPWTEEEDTVLINYVSCHGESRWNNIARSSGLKRTGKSCRLRWLNYLRPDVRRGNITLQEQFLILKLHILWGNRWSKIAQYLPGRTDNEIKNYWRTRVQKQAKHLKCDANSKLFKETMRNVWLPRLLERIQAQSSVPSCQTDETGNIDLVQPAEQAGSCQMMINPINQFEVSSIASESNSPETQVSTFSDGSGLVHGPGHSGLGEINGWGCSEKVLNHDDDYDRFWLLQDQFCDNTT